MLFKVEIYMLFIRIKNLVWYIKFLVLYLDYFGMVLFINMIKS